MRVIRLDRQKFRVRKICKEEEKWNKDRMEMDEIYTKEKELKWNGSEHEGK